MPTERKGLWCLAGGDPGRELLQPPAESGNHLVLQGIAVAYGQVEAEPAVARVAEDPIAEAYFGPRHHVREIVGRAEGENVRRPVGDAVEGKAAAGNDVEPHGRA